MQSWQVLRDTETKIFEIVQSVKTKQAQHKSGAYKRWDEYSTSLACFPLYVWRI